jgi:hypothetical protein
MTAYDYSRIPFHQTQPRENEPRRDAERRRKLRPSDVLTRAAVTELLRQTIGHNGLESRDDVLSRIYANCPATSYFLKAATNPAATTTATWAAELVDSAVVDFIASDMPNSAFAQLSTKAMTVALRPGVGTLKIPSRASPQVLSGAWLAEGSAKPVYSGSLTTTDLVPYKLAALSAFTEEMLNSTAIEQVLREVLAHDLTALLDSALLDATAASATRPAGLWAAATSVTASAATPPGEAMVADLKGLHAAVASGNPDCKTVFIANPAQAIRINVTAPQYTNVIVSGYQAAGSVGAVDASAIAMLVSQPEFALSRSAALHMENTTPLPIGTPGSPATVAAPTRSMFQEDCVALRCVLPTSWAKRRTGATALASSVIW